uniref:chemerin-like receptor 1 isoform X2 n=1 Tax=Semicossyphus pulcher TaxID=241346 RepID=UPI0037E88C2D
MEKTTTAPSYHINTSDGSDRNDSSDEYYYYDDYAELRRSLHIMSLFFYCLVSVLGVLGNGAVIWVTSFKMKKTVNTVWFLNLAVADFFITALLSVQVIKLALDFHWPFGKFMCKLNTTLFDLNMFASVYILVVISVDRCVAVVWPVWARNHRSVRKASCVSLGVWVLALILSAPYFVFRDTGPSDDNVTIYCFDNYILSNDYDESMYELLMFRFKAMTITRLLLGFVVPFTVIVSCYAVIIHRLRRNRTLARQSSRTFKIIAAVITAFFLCWAPFHIFNLIELACFVNNSQTLLIVITIGTPITTGLAFINSCLNPLLYVFVGQGFRVTAYKSILDVMEAAFKEEVSRTSTMKNSQRNEMSTLNSEAQQRQSIQQHDQGPGKGRCHQFPQGCHPLNCSSGAK